MGRGRAAVSVPRGRRVKPLGACSLREHRLNEVLESCSAGVSSVNQYFDCPITIHRRSSIGDPM